MSGVLDFCFSSSALLSSATNVSSTMPFAVPTAPEPGLSPELEGLGHDNREMLMICNGFWRNLVLFEHGVPLAMK